MTLADQIYEQVSGIVIPGFFVTVDITIVAENMPKHIDDFLRKKHHEILHGVNTRKFVYQEAGWRLIFTFFPTDKVVEERYALKNKVYMRQNRLSKNE